MAKPVEPQVLYEDNHLLILNKPAGWLVQGDITGDPTLTDWGKDYIKKKYDKPGAVFLHPCHRLDRPVSGVTIFARTSKSLERVSKLFHDDKIQKTYLAMVQNRPEETSGKLTHWLVKDAEKNITKAYNKAKGSAKYSELDYTLQGSIKGLSLLVVKPKTGRPHQIRVQLAKMNCPIKGDLKYGYPTPNHDKSISLHAYQISLIHPVKKEPLTITCPPDWFEFNHQINGLDR